MTDTAYLTTTLAAIRQHSPCEDGWKKLLKHLGKTSADDELLALVTVLDSNGINDAKWCLRAVKGHDHEREIRLFGVWCARQVQHLMKDPRSIAALDVSERYAAGLATSADLAAARDAAWDAARAARDAAWGATRAARDAARDLAWGAARDAAWDAARAARDAAWDAARAAARAAARDARDAAWGAARGARDAAWAAARGAARAARDAAWDAAGDAQALEFRRRFGCAS